MRIIDECLAALLLAGSAAALAHEPVARCIWLDAATVRCRGVTNYGDAMPGARMEVLSHDGQLLVQGRLAADSTLTFSRPAQPFYVLFEIGPGLQTTIEQDEIGPLPAGERRARWMQR